MSLKFPNFADTARIHYASSDLARCGAQEAGFFWVSYYHHHVIMHYIHFIIMVYHIYFFIFEYFNSLVGMLERRQNERRQWQQERFGVFTHLNPESGPCDLNVSPSLNPSFRNLVGNAVTGEWGVWLDLGLTMTMMAKFKIPESLFVSMDLLLDNLKALLILLSLHQESTFKIIKMICHLFLCCSIFMKTTWSKRTFILCVDWCLDVLNSSGKII